jgi:hypothetical protein
MNRVDRYTALVYVGRLGDMQANLVLSMSLVHNTANPCSERIRRNGPKEEATCYTGFALTLKGPGKETSHTLCKI